VHDEDAKSAGTRCRVGLALKGVEPDEVSRGKVLAPPGTLSTIAAKQGFDSTVSFARFSRWEPRAGASLHLFHAMQDVVVRVDSLDGDRARLVPDSPLCAVAGQPAVLVDLDNKWQRFVGRLSAWAA
jgi:selenocysteine-specific translation elongation factor